MRILITGGSGYIGSHTVLELLESNHEITVIDNFINSDLESLHRVKRITGKSFRFHEMDLLDTDALDQLFRQNDFEAVVHFAALKSVGESVEKPMIYYRNNFCGTLNLVEVMQKYAVKRLIFSSSATVYGKAKTVPILETAPTNAMNPYGRTKLFVEEMLKDVYESDPSWSIIILKYFNPIGAHRSGMIGEDPSGIPNNLLPYITQVAVGRREKVHVFGDDYETPDGSGVRDYIHVVDLAKGHVRAVNKTKDTSGLSIYNLGTGNGYSVFELIKKISEVSNVDIPFEVTHRRAGDIAVCYADATRAQKELGWSAQFGLEEMCRDSWRWQKLNPKGYDSRERE